MFILFKQNWNLKWGVRNVEGIEGNVRYMTANRNVFVGKE